MSHKKYGKIHGIAYWASFGRLSGIPASSVDALALGNSLSDKRLLLAVAYTPVIIAGFVIYGVLAIELAVTVFGAALVTAMALQFSVAKLKPSLVQDRRFADSLWIAINGLSLLFLIPSGINLSIIVAITAGFSIFASVQQMLLPKLKLSTVAFCVLVVYVIINTYMPNTWQYLNPSSLTPTENPIRLWISLGKPYAFPVDAATLWTGHIAGSVLGSSAMAATISLILAWYLRRLDLFFLIGFAAAGIISFNFMGINPVFQLDSGQLILALAFMMARKDLAPENRFFSAASGILSAVAFALLRAQGFSLEAVLFTTVGIQLLNFVVYLIPARPPQMYSLLKVLPGVKNKEM